MSRKIFEEDVMCQTCKAIVEACEPFKDGFGIVLDQTVFFPEGGGQLSDSGWLIVGEQRIPVSHVHIQDEVIVHETAEAIPAGTAVEALLDWPVRFDHMQQHCGEHLLSYAFWKLFQADNVGFHMNPELVTIDLNKEVTADEVRQAEDMVNQQIQEDRPIHAEWMDHTEAAKLTLRKFNEKITGPLRIVRVEGSDVCTCCGTHPPTTGMVGLVKIFRVEKHKDGSRISFLCGRLAQQVISQRLDALGAAARSLSIREEEIGDGVDRLSEEIRQLKEKLHERNQQLFAGMVRNLVAAASPDADGRIRLTVLSDDLEAEEAKELARRLAEVQKARAVVAYESKGRVNYLVALGEGNAENGRDLLQQINTLLGGRGGGRPDFGQGSAPAQPGWQDQLRRLLD